ncbi:Cytochrome c oxidase subunit 5A [Allomyces javanicus]|nr:Cytochrome c oxidase subunit 5A [Allomyces javanicus]
MIRTAAAQLARPVARAAPSRAASAAVATPAAAAAAPAPVSRAVLADVPARWTTLSAAERTTVTDALIAAQRGDWKALTAEEKKALYYIAYGPHTGREKLPKGFQIKVFLATVASVGISFAGFMWIRSLGRERPHTFSKEWQEATLEYAQSQKGNPYTGAASPNATKDMFVSSVN